jgi:hypothetical protein
MASMCSIEMLHFGWRVKPLYIHPVYKLQLYSVEGSPVKRPHHSTAQTWICPQQHHNFEKLIFDSGFSGHFPRCVKFWEFSKYFEKIINFWCSDRGISGRLSGVGVWPVDPYTLYHRFQHESWESDVLNGIM